MSQLTGNGGDGVSRLTLCEFVAALRWSENEKAAARAAFRMELIERISVGCGELPQAFERHFERHGVGHMN